MNNINCNRSKAAAETAAIVPFHCIVCFDEFHAIERPPMVLPCGHTYVCLPCTKRLNRCMECREPLSFSSKPSRGGCQPVVPAQVGPQTLTRFPIPKNLVLLAMMEVAERHKVQEETEDDDEHRVEEDDDEEEDSFNLDSIIGGMATMSGPCGTYAVKEDEGLAVVPTDPRKKYHAQEEEKKIEDEDEETIILREPFLLVRGQLVQVVDFEEGVAKLARGMGYVVASSSQLVKIGDPKEQSCRLEGLLRTIISRGNDLKKTLEENQRIEAGLRKQIQLELKNEPSHPVVDDPLVDEDAHEGKENAFRSEWPSRGVSEPGPSTPRNSRTQPDLTFRTPSSDSILEFDENGVAVYQSPVPPSPNSIDNADIGPALPRLRHTVSADDDMHQFVFGCGSTFLGDSSAFFDNSNDRSELVENNRFRSNSNDVRSHVSIPSIQSSSSFDRVNYRTGMSGHRALMSTKASRNTPRGQIRMMSEHRGISRIGTVRRQSPSSMDGFQNIVGSG